MGSKSDDEEREEELPPRGSEDRIEAKIDRDLKDSFPASDPPGWVLGVRRPSEETETDDDDGSSPAAADAADE